METQRPVEEGSSARVERFALKGNLGCDPRLSLAGHVSITSEPVIIIIEAAWISSVFHLLGSGSEIKLLHARSLKTPEGGWASSWAPQALVHWGCEPSTFT